MPKIALAFFFMLIVITSALAESPAPALYGRLTANRTHIVFSYAGDLWSVERSGGEARRLTRSEEHTSELQSRQSRMPSSA